MKLAGSALAALLLSAASGERGKPPISEQTMRSGGVQDPDQAKLAFDHADLTIEVLPDRRRLKGIARLSFTAGAPLDRLVLDLDPNLAVSAIAIDGRLLGRAAWSNPEGQLRIALPAPVPAGGTLTATIDYGGTPHVAVRAPWDDGIVWAKQPDGTPWVATTTQGYGCDLFWPCIDHPRGEVALLDTRIIVPQGLTAPGNGVLKSKTPLDGGRTAWHWQARSVNPYLFALQIGHYAEIRGTHHSRFGNRIAMHFWHRPDKARQAQGLFAEFAPTLDFFEKFIGPYPWGDEKLGVVETPHMGMEHQTINAYGNDYAKGPASFDWLFQHELAHEWFGNQMTAADWDDFWLHEGFAQYMQPLYEQARVGEARYRVMMAGERERIQNRGPLVSGRSKTADDVYEDGKGGPGQDIYHKGAWLLHTLRYTIGDDAFFAATRRLVYGRPDPKPGNFKPRFVTSDAFVALVSEEAGRDMSWFFDVYLREAALPELVETRAGDTLTLRWKAPGGKPFPLPVEVKIGDRIERVAMAGGVGTVTAPAGTNVTIDPMARVLRALPEGRGLQIVGR